MPFGSACVCLTALLVQLFRGTALSLTWLQSGVIWVVPLLSASEQLAAAQLVAHNNWMDAHIDASTPIFLSLSSMGLARSDPLLLVLRAVDCLLSSASGGVWHCLLVCPLNSGSPGKAPRSSAGWYSTVAGWPLDPGSRACFGRHIFGWLRNRCSKVFILQWFGLVGLSPWAIADGANNGLFGSFASVFSLA